MSENHKPDGAEQKLDALFASYRESCPDPEPGADFMPQLWKRIDANRSFTYSLKRFAQGIITAAAAASLLMGAYLSTPRPVSSSSYLESLAAGQSHDNLADTEIVQALHENNR